MEPQVTGPGCHDEEPTQRVLDLGVQYLPGPLTLTEPATVDCLDVSPTPQLGEDKLKQSFSFKVSAVGPAVVPTTADPR